ncbi:Hypothetical_protein [Hexamita inflata]|uniref:Hypothetical_protein n=1 Tax=Hexamita inflata TaxID=28002 RepID=A0AA86V5B1_9EUKA|nr:Hypothetical protein HINF_LOCUS44928 [Hexamita inflata]
MFNDCHLTFSDNLSQFRTQTNINNFRSILCNYLQDYWYQSWDQSISGNRSSISSSECSLTLESEYLFISRGSKMSWSIHFNTLEYRFKTLWVSPWRKQSESTTPQMDDELQNSHNFQ